MNVVASIALAFTAVVMQTCAASARAVAGFEVPYTFNPIRTGPGWNDSDVWVVTLSSPAEGVGMCSAHRQEQGSNMSVWIADGYAHGEEGNAILVQFAFDRDKGKRFSDSPAKLEFFKDGTALMSLQGTLSANGDSESWSAVLLRPQFHALVDSATNGRISANFSANNSWTATVDNLITSPSMLLGELFPEKVSSVFRREDFTECMRRAKIIGA